MSRRSAVDTPMVARIADFSGGINSTVSPSLLNDNEAVTAINMSLMRKGTLSTRSGRVRRYAVPFATSPVSGMGGYYKRDGTSRLVVTSGASIFADEPRLGFRWTHRPDWDGGVATAQIDLATTPGDVRLTPVTATQTFEVNLLLNPTNLASTTGGVGVTNMGTTYLMEDTTSRTVAVRSAAQNIAVNFANGTRVGTSNTIVVGRITLAHA